MVEQDLQVNGRTQGALGLNPAQLPAEDRSRRDWLRGDATTTSNAELAPAMCRMA